MEFIVLLFPLITMLVFYVELLSQSTPVNKAIVGVHAARTVKERKRARLVGSGARSKSANFCVRFYSISGKETSDVLR